jgi:hypothetical protein
VLDLSGCPNISIVKLLQLIIVKLIQFNRITEKVILEYTEHRKAQKNLSSMLYISMIIDTR